MKVSGVYLITCTVNNKKYIGCSKDVRTRMQDHRNMLTRNNHINVKLQRAWNKYGAESFVFDILLETLNPFEEERRLIAEYKTFGDTGYNLTPGGEGVGADSPLLVIKREKTKKERLTDAQRQVFRNNAIRQNQNKTPEERKALAKIGSDAAKQRFLSMTEEEKQERSRKLSEYSKRRWNKLNSEQRTAQNKSIWDNRTAEQRTASALKAWETRRSKA